MSLAWPSRRPARRRRPDRRTRRRGRPRPWAPGSSPRWSACCRPAARPWPLGVVRRHGRTVGTHPQPELPGENSIGRSRPLCTSTPTSTVSVQTPCGFTRPSSENLMPPPPPWRIAALMVSWRWRFQPSSATLPNVVHLPRPRLGDLPEPEPPPSHARAATPVVSVPPTREIHVVYSIAPRSPSRRGMNSVPEPAVERTTLEIPADVSPIGGMTAPAQPHPRTPGVLGLRTHRKSAHEATCYTGQGTGNAGPRTAARARDGVLHGRCRVGRADGAFTYGPRRRPSGSRSRSGSPARVTSALQHRVALVQGSGSTLGTTMGRGDVLTYAFPRAGGYTGRAKITNATSTHRRLHPEPRRDGHVRGQRPEGRVRRLDRRPHPGASNGGYRVATSCEHRHLAYRFTGTEVTYVANTGPNRGIALVTVAGRQQPGPLRADPRPQVLPRERPDRRAAPDPRPADGHQERGLDRHRCHRRRVRRGTAGRRPSSPWSTTASSGLRTRQRRRRRPEQRDRRRPRRSCSGVRP